MSTSDVQKNETKSDSVEPQLTDGKISVVSPSITSVNTIVTISEDHYKSTTNSLHDENEAKSHVSMEVTSDKKNNFGTRTSYSIQEPHSSQQLKKTGTSLTDLTNSQLVRAVQDLQKNMKQLELENMIFLHFLEKNDPSSLEDLGVTLKNIQMKQERASMSTKRLTLTRMSRRESCFLSNVSVVAPTVSEGKEGPRINITQKTDLIFRELDELQNSLDKVAKRCNIVRHKLKAELEEMNLREVDIRDTIKLFEDVFINETVEKYPQKNPSDKFARFMNDNFKQSRLTIDKIRLRTSSLKVQYHKICNELTQKRQLGANLQEVDFEQLQISNKRLLEKIDKRNLLLLELKRMNGNANLLLSRTKKSLLTKTNDLKELKESIASRESMIAKLDNECEKVSFELEQTKEGYDKIKIKSENYIVPPVIDYVRTKAEMSSLKKNLKIWTRRKQIKEMAFAAALRELKHSTGINKPESAWFQNPEGSDGPDSTCSFEFLFEQRARKRPVKKSSKRYKKKVN